MIGVSLFSAEIKAVTNLIVQLSAAKLRPVSIDCNNNRKYYVTIYRLKILLNIAQFNLVLGGITFYFQYTVLLIGQY